ncbi:thiol-disulfide oxidoreductase DCC family protein [Thermoflavimicrobium dichotomicum]|uniref:Predicted thiol-disulfide oxidoreductase YuxK, DCC family n=1 Tax=Thermoflavimicrobium dichotomicum TaxID=46223 RepID=A0A1I3TYA6_9BACL|nr:thiol-disulfide oxidoreductase DCC family protein [Thermoflavimicrobium dichotomicum]SFJ75463.1 Predicted thiol-disulfide oxidoreductase YuxK, DCC family [Thermoflavimicrobium dichotomicum]
MNHLPEDLDRHSIILFDGVCHFCNGAVQFVIKRDKKGHFRFASLQSKVAQALFSAYQIQRPSLDSIVLIEDDRYYSESTAILRICRKMDGVWKGLYLFMLVPKPVRDVLYRWFAKRRYRFFGKSETCMIPTPEIRERFLEIDEVER